MKTTIKNEKGIITRVSIPDTLRNMDPGDMIFLEAAKTVSYPTAATAVRRINQDPRYGNYRIATNDNGVSYKIERID